MGKLSVIVILLLTIALTQGQDCPPNSFYVDEYGACIHPDNDASPMGYAELYCQAFGGHLVSIHSEFINAMITGIQLTSLTQKRGFLGLRKAANGTYLWSDGTPNDFTPPWADEPPRGDCVSLDSNDKKWRSVDCDSNLPYLCSWPVTTAPDCNSTTPLPISCPRGSTYVEEIQSCLHTNNNLVSFALAEKYCKAFNGHLFSIHDLDTDSFLTGVSYTQINRGYFYIGARKNGPDFAWVDQSPWDYQNWNTGEPRLDCGSIEKRTANWTTVDCTTTLPFMCNIPPIFNGGCPTSAPLATTEGTPLASDAPPTMSPLTCNPPSSQDLYSCYNGWQYFPTTDSSYLVGFNLSYTPADAYCQSQNAQLASVHSASESTFIGALCCTTDCSHRSFGDYAGGFIVGAKKQNQNWVWSDGTPFDYQPSICPETQGNILWILSDNCGDCHGPGDWDYTDTDDAYGVPYFVCKRSGFVTGAVVRELSQMKSHHPSPVRSTRILSKSPQPKKK